jgi:hypothetical protein
VEPEGYSLNEVRALEVLNNLFEGPSIVIVGSEVREWGNGHRTTEQRASSRYGRKATEHPLMCT